MKHDLERTPGMDASDGTFDSVQAFEAQVQTLVWPQTSWIGNAFADPANAELLPMRGSPVDGRTLPSLCAASAGLVDEAVRGARSALERGDWAQQPASARKRVLERMAQQLEHHATELCLMDCLSMGKPFARLMRQDAVKAAECFRWFAELIDKVEGELSPANPSRIGWVERVPLGVVAAITPWNYPLENIAWKLAPALAAGNSVVLKPAEQATYSALRFAQLAARAGLPPHVLNVLVGTGEGVGQTLVEHPGVDAVFFTGSTATGQRVCNSASRHRIKPVSVECGGKSPVVLWSGAGNLKQSVAEVCARIFGNAGQTCNAPSRLIVAAALVDEVRLYLDELASQYAPQDPRVGAPEHGALCNVSDAARIQSMVDTGVRAGAQIWVGGRCMQPVAGGAYFAPTVLANVDPASALAQQELFGPVLCVFTAQTLDDAIGLANDSTYALAAGIYTDHLPDALEFQRRVHAGNVYINGWGLDDISVPFGGLGNSGNGAKDKGLRAYEKCCATRSVTIRLPERR